MPFKVVPIATPPLDPAPVVRTYLATGVLPLSRSISRVQALLRKAQYNAADLAEHMRTDPLLTAKVMAVANSAYFSRQPCETIDEAVNRLGSMQLARIFAQVLAHSCFLTPMAAYGLPAEGLWRRAVFAAVGAELAAGRQQEAGATCYLLGLLHPLGMLVMNRLWVQTGDIRPLARTDFSREYTLDEKNRYRFHQAELGAELLRQLSFPETVCQAIARQYEPPRDMESQALYLGRLVRTLCCDDYAPAADPQILACFGLVPDSRLESFIADVREETQSRIAGT